MKIAILGVENSHADAFGQLVKENPKYSDIEIVGIYSDDEEATKRIIDAGYATYAAKSPDEFVGKVDGVLVTARHGNNHYKYARPYIASGIPMFIVNGQNPEILYDLFEGKHVGTYFMSN